MTFKASCRVHTVTPHSVLNRKQGVSQCPVFLFLAFNPPPALRRRSTLKSKRRSATYRTPSPRSAVPAAGGVPDLHIIVERSTRYAAVVAAGLVLFGLLSPTTVTAQQRASVATDLSVSATATDGASHAVAAKPDRNGTTPLTSHLPWLAPVGHRQPRRADVPQEEACAARARQQFRLDKELDRKLIICRCS